MLKSPNFPSQSPLQSLHGSRRTTSRARGFGAHETAALRGKSRRDTVIVDIASLLKSSDSNESSSGSPHHHPSASLPPPTTTATTLPTGPAAASFALAPGPPSPGAASFTGGGGASGAAGLGSGISGSGPPPLVAQAGRTGGTQGRPGSGGGKRNMPPHTSESPAKKQSKWSPDEDALIIELRGSGMKWDDISKRLPGRSAISCRLHYQNYLERRSEWDEERKNKLARLYER